MDSKWNSLTIEDISFIIHLKSNIKITGGNGTKDNPFEISE